VFQLKQFAITQGDIIRRDAYNKIKTGDPKEIARGFKNLTLYALAMGTALVPINAIKDWLSGRDFSWEDESILLNFAQNFGISRYILDKITDSKAPGKAAVEGVVSIVKPPVISVAERLAESASDPSKLVSMIPLGGRMAYDRAFGGNERNRVNKMMDKISSESKQLVTNRSKDRENIYKSFSSGDKAKFEANVRDYTKKYKLTSAQESSLRSNAKLPADVRKFKSLPLEQQRDILKKMSPSEKARFRPHANRQLRYN
jgi:hypothetical protein